MKIVINACFGGFGLSDEALKFLNLDSDRQYRLNWDQNNKINRTDFKLIKCINTLGSERSSGDYAALKVVEIPDDVDWEIEEYDGAECVVEKHRKWY